MPRPSYVPHSSLRSLLSVGAAAVVALGCQARDGGRDGGAPGSAAAAQIAAPPAPADRSDPIAALALPTPNPRYAEGYWRAQATQDTSAGSLWRRAVAYCGDVTPRPGLELDGAKPNCRPVLFVGWQRKQSRSTDEFNARLRAKGVRPL